jgi:hypothetical protein
VIRTLPKIITHNYDPARGAFRNICDLPEAEAERILYEIRASGKRRVRANYLVRRRATEAWLLTERTRKLGRPRVARPIYFFLGDFADGQDPSRPQSIRLPLAMFSSEMVTFTYPDSMASLPIATREDHAAIRRAHHGQVFTLEEITKLVAMLGMPDKSSSSHDRFIEVQVWDDEPIRAALAKRL